MNKINFLVVGAQKSGSSTIDDYLRKHEDICLPNSRKEVHFFDNDLLFNTQVNYDYYHKFFENCQGTCRGEVTPSYMYWKPAIARIYTYNPTIRILVILRNPIHRAYSHWNMQRQRNLENRTFLEAIRSECKSLESRSIRGQNLKYSYVSRGLYFEQILRIFLHHYLFL